MSFFKKYKLMLLGAVVALAVIGVIYFLFNLPKETLIKVVGLLFVCICLIGFVILRISQDKKPALEKVREDILTTLTNEKLAKDETLSIKTMIEVRKKYNLDIVDSDILSQYKKSIKDYE
jgi:predicted tellurium resistance membrane protein TerC